MIYLDNSATTRPNEACVAAMNELLTECWFNPSSVYRPGMDAAHRLKTARAQVAQALGAETERVFFTSGGTEADNWAIFSTAKRLGKRGRHIVTTAVEHHAVLHPMQQLEAQGFEVTYLQPDETGFVSVEALKAALRPDTILVSIMMVNNESGAVMPIADMVRATRRLAPLALFHTDAVQGFLKVPFKAKTLGADLISISGHKVHGPKGVGALYIKPGLPLPAFIHGGGQEGNFRSGTENVPGIVGMGKAVELAFCNMRRRIRREMMLRNYLIEKIMHEIKGVRLNGHPTNRLPGNVNVSFSGVDGASLLILLYEDGICASGGSACNTGEERVSYVIGALGVPDEYAPGTVRMTLSGETTREEIDRAVEALKQNLRKLRDEK